MAHDPEIPDDEAPMVRQEADNALRRHGGDAATVASAIERALELDNLKPRDPPLWRAVVRYLRRRAAGA